MLKPQVRTLEELNQRTDALALAIGSRATASVLLLACVVVILLGAQSLLGTMEAMNRDLDEMNEQLAIANGGLEILNVTMDSVPPQVESVRTIVGTIEGVSTEVEKSSASIQAVEKTTGTLNTQLGAIAGSTGEMRASLETAGGGTDELATTIVDLNDKITPLVDTQHQMLQGTRDMRSGLDGMNASLAYTIRIMNWITRPPHGGGMTINADLPKETLPPLPGIRAEVEPVAVFPRDIWPVYTGP